MTWEELDELSGVLAAGYLDSGLEPGDRIASLMPNRYELIVHYLACFKAGLVATPLNYRYTAAEIDHALGISEARMLLAHVEREEDLAASERVARLPLGTIGYREAEHGGAAFQELLERDRPNVALGSPRAHRSGGDLLHVGQHGPAEGRDAHARGRSAGCSRSRQRGSSSARVTSCWPGRRSPTSEPSTCRSGR